MYRIKVLGPGWRAVYALLWAGYTFTVIFMAGRARILACNCLLIKCHLTLKEWIPLWDMKSRTSLLLYSTHWARGKMDAILQTTLSNAFPWMKIFELWLNFHRSLFLMVKLIIFQHWFRKWLGADQAKSHYLIQWLLDNLRIYASLGRNELSLSADVRSEEQMISSQYHEIDNLLILTAQQTSVFGHILFISWIT